MEFKLAPEFQISAYLASRFKYNLIFMKFGFQSRENTIVWNILFGIDDLDPHFGFTIEVLNKFVTKNKQNILIDIHCLYPGQNSILKLQYALLLFTRLEIEIAVKSQRNVWNFLISLSYKGIRKFHWSSFAILLKIVS